MDVTNLFVVSDKPEQQSLDLFVKIQSLNWNSLLNRGGW